MPIKKSSTQQSLSKKNSVKIERRHCQGTTPVFILFDGWGTSMNFPLDNWIKMSVHEKMKNKRKKLLSHNIFSLISFSFKVEKENEKCYFKRFRFYISRVVLYYFTRIFSNVEFCTFIISRFLEYFSKTLKKSCKYIIEDSVFFQK